MPAVSNGAVQLQNKFFSLLDRMNRVEAMVDAAATGLFGKKHIYKKENLVTELEKLESFVKIIENMIGNWAKNGKLSKDEFTVYRQNRETFARRFRTLQNKIYSRKSTWLERIIDIIKGIEILIKTALPPAMAMLRIVGKELSPPALQKLLSYAK